MPEEIKKLYVGRLDWNTTLEDLVKLFATVGEVDTENPETQLKTKEDEVSHKTISRGFAFIVMKTVEDAKKVIAEFNGYKLGRMNITVDFARPMEPRTFGAGGGNRSGGFGGGNRSGGFGGGNRSGGFGGGNRSGGFNKRRDRDDNSSGGNDFGYGSAE